MKLDAMSTLIQGLGVQAANVDKAARDIQAATIAAQNTIAAAQTRPETGDVIAIGPQPAAQDVDAVVAANTRAAAVAADGDLVKPIVDLLQAAIAYKANIVALKITADVEAAVGDLLGKRTDI